MRVLWLLLSLILAFPYLAGADNTGAVSSNDGSLVLSGQGNKPAQTSKDTLSVLLSREVDVFIFRQQTRVWPQGTVIRGAFANRPLAPAPHLDALIHKYSTLYGVDPALVRAVMRHESGFNPQAVSPKGAQGLMQLMPGTADLMGVRNPFDPEQNIAGGVGYLRHCLDRVGHSVPLAVAAYNAGPERVVKTGTVPPIAETQTFVTNVMGTYQGQGQAPAGATRKSAHMVTPGTAKQVVAAKPVLASQSESTQPEKKVRKGPKVIEVRQPKAKKVAAAGPES